MKGPWVLREISTFFAFLTMRPILAQFLAVRIASLSQRVAPSERSSRDDMKASSLKILENSVDTGSFACYVSFGPLIQQNQGNMNRLRLPLNL